MTEQTFCKPRAYLQPHTMETPPVLVCGTHRYTLDRRTAAYLASTLLAYLNLELAKSDPPSDCLRGDG